MLEKVFNGPRGIRPGWRLLIFLVLAGIPFFAINLILQARGFHPNFAHGIPPTVVLVGDSVLFGSVLLAAWVMSRLEHKSLGLYGLPGRGAFGRQFWAGAVIGLAALSLLMVGIWLGGGYSFGGLDLGARGILYFGIFWALAFLAVGFAEEFLFRGYSLATLSESIRFWPAAIVLSVLFGAVHLQNVGENPIGALSAALVGLLFCFSLRRSGSLWFAIGLHAGWNYAESFIYSVPNSGTVAEGHLLSSHFQAAAPVWLTGGSVGPEGSVLVFIVLAMLFLMVHWMYPEVQFPSPAGRNEPLPAPETNILLGGPEASPERD